ncbi:MAG TPA: diacylglycerol kinase family protein [Pedococcus sp.]|nr:diacylglycerol kinase family protein [Pedococcus sp.]
MLHDHAGWLLVGAAALILIVALGIAGWAAQPSRRSGGAPLGLRWGRRPHRNEFRPEGTAIDDKPRRRAAVIINPTKFDDVAAVRRRVTARCAELGWDEPLFLLTTEQDPGTGQAEAAISEGVDIVCPLGGDGTVRAVAAGLVGTDTPMGLLPGGTGNLLARNLDLPVDDLNDALRVALTGQNKRIDVGELTVDMSGEHEKPQKHIFLVMAGLGFDAAMMAGAPERLKAKVGPAAYVVSGARNLRGPQFKVHVEVEGQEAFTRRTRTVVIGNCGKLLGGFVLMPEAVLDDGLLDSVILSPTGVVGWAAIAARLASRRRKGHSRVEHHTSKEIRVRIERPQEVQLDGDPIGKARAISATVLPRALVVRVGSAG